MRILENKISPWQEGWSVLRYLKQIGLSSREIRRVKFRRGGIRKNGEQVTVRELLHAGDLLAICLEEGTVQPADPADAHGATDNRAVNSQEEKRMLPWPGPLDVLYRDEDLLIVNKPSGMASHPSPGHYADTLLNRAVYYLETEGESTSLHILGRLDKDTSGVVVFARNQMAAAALDRQKRTGQYKKEYLAVVNGKPEPADGYIQAPIGPRDHVLQWMEVRSDGKPAGTYYQLLDSRDGFSLVRLWLDTGRTHQIRVHMAYLGHPLAGDPGYGFPDGSGFSHAALHAERICLIHPVTGQELDVRAPLPEDWKLYRAAAFNRERDY